MNAYEEIEKLGLRKYDADFLAECQSRPIACLWVGGGGVEPYDYRRSPFYEERLVALESHGLVFGSQETLHSSSFDDGCGVAKVYRITDAGEAFLRRCGWQAANEPSQ